VVKCNRRDLTVSLNALRFQHSNKNVLGSGINCSKSMSVCLRWAGRQFQSSGLQPQNTSELRSGCRSAWRRIYIQRQSLILHH